MDDRMGGSAGAEMLDNIPYVTPNGSIYVLTKGRWKIDRLDAMAGKRDYEVACIVDGTVETVNLKRSQIVIP